MVDASYRTSAVAAAVSWAIKQTAPWSIDDMCKAIPRGPHLWSAADEADRIRQKWRKKGWASFTRDGQFTIWTLTEEGRKALAKGNIAHA